MQVAIIGQGHVGRAFRDYVADHLDVVAYDPATDPDYPTEAINASDFAVICVPTPSDATGACDTSIVEAAVERLDVERVLIASTVAPGTTDRLRDQTGRAICCAPVFVGESTYVNSRYPTIRETPFLIVGGAERDRTWFFEVFERISGPACTYYGCSAVEAELIKYMDNAFLATKVTFVNEFFEIAQALGVDWHRVREGWLLDERVGRDFSGAFAADRGFSGKCLPKDLRAIVRTAEGAGYVASLLNEVDASNERFRTKLGEPT